MDRVEVQLRYEGPALLEHKMDVADLAPAVGAFGDLCREANRVINGDRGGVRVYIHADIGANCITLSFDIVRSIAEQAMDFVRDDRVATIKEIIEWVGIIACPAGLSLFGILRLKKKPPSIIDPSTSEGNVIQIVVDGNNNHVTIQPNVMKLRSDAKVVRAAKGVLRPVATDPGIDKVSFHCEGIKQFEADKSFSSDVLQAETAEESTDVQSEVIGHITAYRPTFDSRAKNWKFRYSGNVETIDISNTSIAADILRRGKAVVGDTWKVKMLVTERKTADGFKNHFEIVEVLDFAPGTEQGELSLHTADSEEDDENNHQNQVGL